jgi:hypothetical protein
LLFQQLFLQSTFTPLKIINDINNIRGIKFKFII